MKKSVLTIAILISGLFIASQVITGSGKKEQTTEDHDHTGGDSTHHHDDMKMDSTAMAYACPMHPEITGKEGDKCSKCEMKLVTVKSTDSTATHHDH
ncbi:MAG: heavy metal-binding domain-containing protein [Bacteroidota bacterium]